MTLRRYPFRPVPIQHTEKNNAPGIESSEKGKARDSVPESQATGNIQSKWNGDKPIIGTNTTAAKNSIVVFTVCLVIPRPDLTYLRMPSIHPNVIAAHISHRSNATALRTIENQCYIRATYEERGRTR